MLKEIITTGETVEVAFENALQQLSVTKDEVEMEVLEQATKKTLGLFGGNPAKIKVTVKELTPVQKASKYINDIFSSIGVDNIEIDVKEEENSAELNISGEDIKFIIGHRGDTLDSLQYLASLVANNDRENYYRISIDVGGFRAKREDVLANLGKKMAAKAIKYGRNQRLEPMNPYERRIIHFAVQDIEGVKSWSEGEDLGRHVVIGPEAGEKFKSYRNDNKFDNKRKPNNNKFQKDRKDNFKKERPFKPRISETAEQPFSPAPLDDAPIERKKAEDAPLYGRIR